MIEVISQMNYNTSPMDKDQNLKAFLKDLERIESNPIFFLEEYWNKLHPDQILNLADDEKETIFKNHRTLVPHFESDETMHSFMRKYDAAKAQGLKDWEIF